MSKKVFAMLFIAFVFGFFAAPRTKEVIKTDEAREANWVALKKVDDEGFLVASDGFGACSDFATAVSNLDPAGMKAAGNEMASTTVKLTKLGADRAELVEKLGLE